MADYPKPMTENDYRSMSEDMTGICRGCGYEQGGCEPDAREYECESCGERMVYGLEELLMMGCVEFLED